MNKHLNTAAMAIMLVMAMAAGLANADDMKSSDTMMHDTMKDDGMKDGMKHDTMKKAGMDDMKDTMKSDTMHHGMSGDDKMMADDMKTMDDKGMHGDTMDK